MDNKLLWNDLHKQQRFCPVYPHEKVVAWVFRNFPKNKANEYSVLDIGCGAGRHSIFLSKEGYKTYCCDYSKSGIDETNKRASDLGLKIDSKVSGADDLPYDDNAFDGVVSFAVLYYLPFDRFIEAVKEIRRILKDGAKAFVVIRAIDDSRSKNTEQIGANTFRILSLPNGAPSDSEMGMIMTFLDKKTVYEVFKEFSDVVVDKATVSYSGGEFVDSDWYIYLTK